MIDAFQLPPPTQDRYGVLLRAVSRDGDERARTIACEILLRGVRTWFLAGGAMSLERCCGLPSPTARRAFDRAQRDFWLGEAHRLCTGATSWRRSLSLHDELKRFRAVIWPQWCVNADPPPGASDLRTALFRAMQFAQRLAGADGCPAMPGTARGLDFAVKGNGVALSLPSPEHGGSEIEG